MWCVSAIVWLARTHYRVNDIYSLYEEPSSINPFFSSQTLTSVNGFVFIVKVSVSMLFCMWALSMAVHNISSTHVCKESEVSSSVFHPNLPHWFDNIMSACGDNQMRSYCSKSDKCDVPCYTFTLLKLLFRWCWRNGLRRTKWTDFR